MVVENVEKKTFENLSGFQGSATIQRSERRLPSETIWHGGWWLTQSKKKLAFGSGRQITKAVLSNGM